MDPVLSIGQAYCMLIKKMRSRERSSLIWKVSLLLPPYFMLFLLFLIWRKMSHILLVLNWILPSILSHIYQILQDFHQKNLRSFSQRIYYQSTCKKFMVSCKYWKKIRYTVDQYHKLHGFPSDFKFSKGKRIVAYVQLDQYLDSSGIGPPTITGSFHDFSEE